MDALVAYLERRSLARRARAFILLGWCSATASWAAFAAGLPHLRAAVLLLACALLAAWQRGLVPPWRTPGRAAPPAPVSATAAAVPVAALVAFTTWPTLFFVLTSLAFLLPGALPRAWRQQVGAVTASALKGGLLTPRARPRTPPPLPPLPPLESPPWPLGAPAESLRPAADHEAELAALRAALEGPVEISALERGRTVGLGSYGRVLLVRHAATGTPYALKCLARAAVVAAGQQRAVARERAVMTRIAHPFCARLVRSFADAEAVYLLLEWCPGGELLRHLPRTSGLPPASARFYTACVAAALAHLHAADLVYRDVKPENCLLDARGYLKLCDFGFAKRLPPDGLTHTVCGTPDFMAPEVIRGVGHGAPADVWALGCLLYELLTGRPPFAERGAPPAAVYAAILACAPPPPLPSAAGAEAALLLAALLAPEAAARPRWGAVQGHAWFSGLDWAALERRELPAPLVPPLGGPLDTRHFEAVAEDAAVLSEGQAGAAAVTEEELFGAWASAF